MRPPAVAGTFYAAEKDALIKQIESAFLSKFGPGKLPEPKEQKRILGAIVPHAGYVYSGPCAAHVYFELARARKPDTVVLIGPSHHGALYPASVWDNGPFVTPLGKIEIDHSLIQKLPKDFVPDPAPHIPEHCLEVQLPFLQYIYKQQFKIVPILFSFPIEQKLCEKYGRALASILNERMLILASSDFSHVGPLYRNLDENASERDKKALEAACALDLDKFCKLALGSTICGASAIGVLLAALSKFNPSGRLLKFYSSGDISGDFVNYVNYGAVIFEA